MKTRMITAISAAALSAALMTGVPAMSQERMLSDSATSGMAALGMNTTDTMVTADQAAQIENVLGSTDTDEIKRGRIEEILGNDATETGRLGGDQLRSSAKADMSALGLDTEGVEMLSIEQLAAIENVTGSSDYTDDQKRAQINEITGETMSGEGAMGANQDAIMADVGGLGIDTSTIGVLSQDQMTQIQNVMSTSDSNQVKRQRVEQIIAE